MAKIDEILSERILVPLRREWMIKGGRGAHDRSPFLLVRVRSEGIEGLGEVSGTYIWSGEGFETAEAAIRHVLLPALAGSELTPRRIRAAMDGCWQDLRLPKPPLRWRAGTRSGRCAASRW